MARQRSLAATRGRQAADRSPRIALDAIEVQLLHRYDSEIQAAAVSCAVLLTYHEARKCGLPVALPAPHETLVPYVPLTTPAIAGSSFAAFMTEPNASMLNALPYYLTRAKSAMENILFSDLPPHTKFGKAIEEAIEPLRAAATFLIVALDDLATLAQLVDRPAGVPTLARLRGTLASTLDGGTPLLAEGVIELPETDIVIRDMRRSVDFTAQLQSGGRTRRVRVVNISQGGFCISGAPAMKAGDPVVLRIDSGRELRGTVMWTEGPRAGVRLNSRLLMADPLINH